MYVPFFFFKESSNESTMDEDESPNKVNTKMESKARQAVSTPQSRATSARSSRRNLKEEKDFVRGPKYCVKHHLCAQFKHFLSVLPLIIFNYLPFLCFFLSIRK